MQYLNKLKGPEDLKNLSIKELEEVGQEIRETVISVTSNTGGHLAPSLGVVELTLAIHSIFDSPKDRVVWDVGHQAYAHKLLTGRYDKFSTLRQYQGLSGFPKRSESVHDAFNVGHASTSISSALGIAKAESLSKRNGKVIAVIGDGALTGGLSFEGINNAGALKENLLVILNDNNMSISPNVGAMSKYMNRVISDPLYNKVKNDIWDMTGKLGSFTDKVRSLFHKVDETLKNALLPGKFFENLGFRYLGPIDGHNLSELKDILSNIKTSMKGPIFLHVITKKGKGYEPAENNASRYHGVASFEKMTGETSPSNKMSYSEVFGKTLVELANKNDKIVGITAAMRDNTGMKDFAEKYPKRFFDAGIAEGHAVTFAGGLSVGGFLPVVAIYSTFLQRAYDNIIQDIAIQDTPAIFCIDRSGLTPDDGPTHHGLYDIAFLSTIPKAVVMAPKDGTELRNMMHSVESYGGHSFIRYPRGASELNSIDGEIFKIEKGKVEILSTGKDILFVALGEMVTVATEIANLLKKEQGLNITVVNARFAKPILLDEYKDLLNNHNKVFTFEAGVVDGAFGSFLLGLLVENNIKFDIFKRFGFGDKFYPHGTKEDIMLEATLDVKSLKNKIVEIL